MTQQDAACPWLLSIPALSPGRKMGDQGKALPALLFFPLWCNLTVSERCRLSFRWVSLLPSKSLAEGSPFLPLFVPEAVTFLCFFSLTEAGCFSFQVKSYWYSAGLFLRVNLKSLMPSLLTPNRFSSVTKPTNVPMTLEFTLPQHAHAFINTDHIVEIPCSAKLIKAHTDPVQRKIFT